MTFETLNLETLDVEARANGVQVITINRPARRNAMNSQMMCDLGACFAECYKDPDNARCLVLTGAGDKAFCAGADLKERHDMDEQVWGRQHALLEQAMRAMSQVPVPMIAMVNGAAIGGGLELALACDFIYAAPHVRFAMSEVTLGIIPGAMGTQNLPRAVGLRRAKQLILTGAPFTADEALRWGLVNEVVPVDQLRDDVLRVADHIASNAPIAVRQAKKALDHSADLDRAAGYAFELEAYNRTIATEDRHEGINAFNEKRRPVFKGR